jgi:alkylhydroperoxidase family enzyme
MPLIPYADTAAFDAKEKSLLKLSEEVIRHVRGSEAAVAEAKKHFSPQEIVEIIMTCGFYMTIARMTETLQVDVDVPGGDAIVRELERMR